jgi:hypothetical protein
LRKAFNDTVNDPEFLTEAAKTQKEIHLIKGEELEALVQRVLSAPRSATDLLKAALSTGAK